jgi:hypothetical protein
VLGAERERYCAAVDSAGGAENWALAPALRDRMVRAVQNARAPILFLPSRERLESISVEGSQRCHGDCRKICRDQVLPSLWALAARGSFLRLLRFRSVGGRCLSVSQLPLRARCSRDLASPPYGEAASFLGHTVVGSAVFRHSGADRNPYFSLPNDCNELVHRHTADAAAWSGISRCQNERLVARSDGSVNVDCRATFFRSLDQGERVAGKTNTVMTVRIHPPCGKIADANCRRLFRPYFCYRPTGGTDAEGRDDHRNCGHPARSRCPTPSRS